MDYLQKSLKLDPLNGNAYLNLGIIFLGQNLFDNAIKMFDQALSIYKNSSYRDEIIASTYKNKALSYIGLQKFDKMRDNYLEALKYNKDTELAYGFICYANYFVLIGINLNTIKT